MTATWIVSANAGRARFFSEEQPGAQLQEVGDMLNDAVRLRTAEMETDRMGPTSGTGSTHNTGGQVPNKTYEPHQTPHERETEVFVKSINKFLLQEHQQGRFKQLALVASPEFLGALRMYLDPHLKPLVGREINKDYTQLSPLHLRDQLAQQHQEKPRQ